MEQEWIQSGKNPSVGLDLQAGHESHSGHEWLIHFRRDAFANEREPFVLDGLL